MNNPHASAISHQLSALGRAAASAIFLAFATTGWGQTLFDTFGDGNFSANPTWSGNTTAWGIQSNSDAAAGATGSNTLRLASTGSATVYLSSQISSWGDSQEWGIWIGRRAQGFTAANQAYFWLVANESDLRSATVDGYRLAIGDDTGGDEIRLEYIVNGAVSATVITSSGSLNNNLTDIGFLVRVTRSSSGGWALFTSSLPTSNGNGAIATDVPNSTNANVSQGTATNNTQVPASNNWLGLAALHSSGANAIISTEYDQIYFTPITAPTVTTNSTVTSISTTGATLGGNITNINGANATVRGFEYSTSSGFGNGTGTNSTDSGDYGNGTFTKAVSSLTANTLYYFKAKAQNSAGTGWGAEASFTTLPLPPTVGTGSSATSSGFTANWSHPTMGSASYTYTVEVDNDSNFGSIDSTVTSISSSSTSQAITGLSPSTTYYYRIKSVNAQGDSAWSSGSAGIATSAPSSPTITPTGSFSALSTFTGTASAPSSISVSGTDLTADITATRPSADFEVSSNNSTWGSTATFAQSGGSASGTLYVRIASGAAVGTPSGNVTLTSTGAATVNAAVSGTVNKVDPTAHVTNFATGTITTSNIPLIWTAATGSPDGYLIRVSSTTVTDPTDGTAVADDTSLSDGVAAFNVTSGATTSYSSFTGFAAGTTYTFKIYPYNNSGSNIRYRTDATVPSVTGLLLPAAPSTPTFSSVSSSGFTVNWSTVTGATNYQLDLATDSGFTSMVSGYGNFTTGNVTSQAVTGLTANVTYHARLRALNSTGTSASSTSASQTTSQLTAPVASAATSVTSSGFNANWSAVTNATNYRLDVYSNSTVTPTTTDLLITEYVEGTSNNKYIEIFNGTGATVDLSNYALMQFTNGSESASSNVTLSGNLSNGQTVVYKNSSALLTLPEGVIAANNSAVGYNGDDAVALFKISTGTYVDIIGRIGNDPGTAWTGNGSYSTLDKTLRRKGTVTSGITTSPTGTGASAFTTLETEWDVFDVDTANGLGSHTLNQTTGQTYLLQDQATGNVTTYAVTGASVSTQYSYVLRATSSTSTSANSNVITVTTNASATPPMVTGATLNGTVGTAFAGHTVSATNSPTGYAVESGSLPTGLSLNATTGAISGTPTAAGNSSVTINATNAAGSGNATFNFNIAKGNQTITFGAQAALGVGSTRAVGATASSGLTVTYSSSNTSVATISGGNVSGVAVGNTTITASQAGDANWNAATPVDQALSVAVLPVTWNFTTASPANVPSGSTVSDVTHGNINGSVTLLTSTTPSDTYSGNSSGNNAGAAARTGALNTGGSGSAYFEFSANATSGNYITFTGISLGTRSTGTGPQAISLRSDADSYASDIVTFTTSNGSTWQLVSNSTFSQVYEGNRTFRLYGHSGTGSATASTANWRIDDLALTLSVSAKTTPTVTVSVGSYTYDGAVKGPVSGDVSTGGSSGAITMSYVGTGGTSYGSSATRPTAAGTYTATASVAATTTHNAASSAATAFTISQRSVTGSFTANNKTYDGSNSATVSGTSLSNTIGGDTISLTGGTATFSDAAAANGKTVTLAGASLTGASSANYTLGSVNTTTANITAASVTVTAGNQTKTFGASDPTLTYTPIPALIAGNSFSGALSRAAGEGVGTYAISQGTLSAGSNYTISFVGANLTITQATPSITTAPTASAITYGQALSASNITPGTSSVAGTYAFVSPSTTPAVGTASQSITFTPTDTGNYTTASTSASVTVNQAALTITGIAIANKTYDGNDAATITGTAAYSGLVMGETHSVTGTGSATFGNSTVGSSKPVTVTGYTAPNGNYSISQPTGLTGNITAASVTVTAGNQTKAFGASDPTLTYTPSPALIAGNSFSGALSRAAGEGVGTYAISQGTLSAGSNYTITFVGANLTITQATPSITTAPTASTITSGQALSSSTLSGGVASVSGNFAFTAPGTVPSPGVSSQGVTFTPADTGNYTTQTTSVDVGVLCTAPVLTRASNPTGTGFTVNWGAVTGASNYTVLHSASKNMSNVTSADTTSTSLALTVSTGIRYVQVRANNAAGASANSTTQVNQLQALAAGSTAYLSVPGLVNGNGGNATIAEKFGPANEAGLATTGVSGNSTNIILINANGSSQSGVFFHAGNWVRGGSIVNDEVIPGGKGFMLRNNSGSIDYILLVGSPAEGPRQPLTLSTDTSFTLVAPGLARATTITEMIPGTPQTTQGNGTVFKAATNAYAADQVIVPSPGPGQPAQIYFYHPSAKGGPGWFVNGFRVTTETIPSGRGVFIRRGPGSILESWTPPEE